MQKFRNRLFNKPFWLLTGCCTVTFSLLFGCNLVMGKAPTLCEKVGIHLELEIVPGQGGSPVTPETITKTQKILSTRLNNLGLKDVSVTATGTSFSVDLLGVKDEKEAVKVLGDTAQLEFRSQKPETEEKFTLARKQTALDQGTLEKAQKDQTTTPAKIQVAKDQLSKSNRELLSLFTKPVITGEDIEDARPEDHQVNNGNQNFLDLFTEPSNSQKQPKTSDVALTFNSSGAQKFTELTKELAGTGRSIGIFLDNQLISTPTVDHQFKINGITGGKAVITGNFAAKEAENLAVMLRSGSLPHKIQVVTAKSMKPGDLCK